MLCNLPCVWEEKKGPDKTFWECYYVCCVPDLGSAGRGSKAGGQGWGRPTGLFFSLQGAVVKKPLLQH